MEKNIVLGSMRPDGSRRKDIEIKPGYVNQEEVPKYVIPQRRFMSEKPKKENLPATLVESSILTVIPTVSVLDIQESESAMKKRLRRQRQRQAKAKRTQEQNNDDIIVDDITDMLSSVTLEDKSAVEEAAAVHINEKEIRKLRKKLREIEKLEKKFKQDDYEPNDDESKKFNSKQSILDKIAQLEKCSPTT